MTVLAAEEGTAAVEAEGADASTAGRTATRRTGGRTQQGTSRTRRVSTRVVKTTPQGRAATRALPSGVARNRRRTKQAATTAGRKVTGNYHGAVFAEWLAAVLLVGLLPFARPNKTGVSPYSGKDMVQLFWITLLYLILAILAVPGKTTAKFASMFGLLVLLAVGLSEAANIAYAVAGILNPQSTGTGTTKPATVSNPSTINPGSQSPANTSTGIARHVAQQPGTGLS